MVDTVINKVSHYIQLFFYLAWPIITLIFCIFLIIYDRPKRK